MSRVSSRKAARRTWRSRLLAERRRRRRSMTAKLTWDVFVGPPAPLAGGEARPGQMDCTWSPISATLISGEHDPCSSTRRRASTKDARSPTGSPLEARTSLPPSGIRSPADSSRTTPSSLIRFPAGRASWKAPTRGTRGRSHRHGCDLRSARVRARSRRPRRKATQRLPSDAASSGRAVCVRGGVVTTFALAGAR
jgi:hypothetical protein